MLYLVTNADHVISFLTVFHVRTLSRPFGAPDGDESAR